jgi:hypothetical protein
MEKHQNYKADLVIRSAELAAALSAGGKEISELVSQVVDSNWESRPLDRSLILGNSEWRINTSMFVCIFCITTMKLFII